MHPLAIIVTPALWAWVRIITQLCVYCGPHTASSVFLLLVWQSMLFELVAMSEGWPLGRVAVYRGISAYQELSLLGMSYLLTVYTLIPSLNGNINLRIDYCGWRPIL